jgi:hypothetical protein
MCVQDEEGSSLDLHNLKSESRATLTPGLTSNRYPIPATKIHRVRVIQPSFDIGVRRLMRESELSQKTVYKILAGAPVRRHTLSSFREAVDGITI